eukprot:TRINITY_DN21522_c0_g1_i1.p1 TRINITY_DN21522_c0_g1~~TRINITY_DN21522_c0_g1_i1.p1  ORF type:complete len:226 (-),score=22.28 TRINITY_DN21522_c0_g1_i1:269-946(-)
MSEKGIRVTYLDLKGFAESLRLTLVVGGVSFEDRRVSYEEVAKLRAAGQLPFGQVPIVECDGRTISQSGALLRWAGHRTGLYPLDQQPDIDAVLEGLNDVKKSLGPQWYGNAMLRSPKTGELFPETALLPEQRAAVTNVLNTDVLPERFAQLERFVAKSPGPFVCGDRITIADLELYVMIDGFLEGTYAEGITPKVLDGCPRLREVACNVAAHEAVAAWNRIHST